MQSSSMEHQTPDSASSSGGSDVVRQRATLDPHKPLEDVNYDEIKDIDMRSDDTDEGEIRAPFYVLVGYLDTSNPSDLIPGK